MLLSFIIPLYNGAASIERCLESICSLALTSDAFEAIIVDDGSKDDGASLMQRFATTNQQVCLVSQPNRGTSSARNRGLELARGKYIWFVDADFEIILFYMVAEKG